jgi:hypothetical protein
VRSLLLLLDEGAAAAAARKSDVGQATALEVVLAADLGTLHGEGDAGKANAGGSAEEQALWESLRQSFCQVI